MARNNATATTDAPELEATSWEDESDGFTDIGDEGFSISETPEHSDEFPVLPKGTYPGRVTDCEFKISSSGNPMLQFEFDFIDPTTGVKVKVWHYAVLSEEQRPRA